jgi:2-dehydro-3-deoxyphosphogluconate aldolase/(4S)-4-hydroxy-2-oxoglutarate aldolase
MAQYSRLEVLQTVTDQKLMPLFYHDDVELGKSILKACYDGGGRLLEFTNRGDFAHETFGALNRYALKELPGMLLGVGSIVDAPTAALYMQLGAHFIVSAALRPDIARICNRRKVAYMPGCASLSEIGQAEELGCEIVKLFPGSVYGANFIKSVMAPQPWTRIMPTGGVSTDEDNLTSWFGAGAVCVGMGSKLISSNVIKNRDLNSLTEKVRDTLSLIQRLTK